ncbi:hypothetical protein V6N13_122851 [Hibiscus sabdariffa]
MAHLELSIPWHGSTKQPRRPTYLKFENSYPEGNFGGNQLLDGSISLSAPIPKSDERFARQYRCGLHQSFLWLPPRSRHSSPSFGSRQACSHSNPSQKIKTPWSVFQDGPDGEPAVPTPVSTLGAEARRETARAGFHDRGDDVSTGVSKARAWGRHHDPRRSTAPSRSADRALAVPHPTGGASPAPIPLPSRQFQALFDSLFKVLFIFPSRYLFAIGLIARILALDGIYRPIRAAFPNNPTRRQAPRGATGSGHDGALTLSGAPFQGTWARSVAEDASPDYNSDAEGDRFSSWAIPGSLAVTKGILAGFDNDPSAGSPTETLLRLLLPLNDKVQWTSRDVAGSEPPTSPAIRTLHRPFNRPTIAMIYPHHDEISKITRGLVGQGYRLVEYISVARVRPRTSKGITDLLFASNFLGLSGHSPSKKLATEDHLRVAS